MSALFPPSSIRLFGVLFLLLFWGCSDNRQGEEFSFERQPQGLRAMTEGEGDSLHWVLQWEPPADLERLIAYHLWAVLTDETGDVVDLINRQSGYSDDLKPSSLPSGIHLWSLPIDSATSDEIIWRIPDSVHVIAEERKLSTVRWLLWAEYSSGVPGNRISTRVYYRDVFPPEPVIAAVEPYADSARIYWRRPFDLSDNLDPSRSGEIFGYRLLLIARNGTFSGKLTFTPSGTFSSADLLPDRSIVPSDLEPLSSQQIISWPARSDTVSLVLLDGKRLSNDDLEDNLLGVTIHGLQPLREYIAKIIPYDSLGVLRDLDDNPAEVRVVEFTTTDNSKPRFVGPFTLEATTSPGLYALSFFEAIDAETTISHYLFERIDRDTVENFADTLAWMLPVDEMIKQGRVLSSALDYLVPGVQISLRVIAVDASGHISDPVDTTFTLPSSVALDCPAGMVPVAGGEELSNFCVERFEHRDSSRFIREVRWDDAQKICQNLSDASWSVDLCSETEWVRACTEGTDRSWGVLTYDEELLPQLLLQECHVGTGDSTASASTSSRSLRCTTGNGVRDLPGHYQEWVIGPQSDSLRIKGGSWLRGNGIDQSTQQSLASCAAHSKGIWSRPRFVLRGNRDTLFILGDSTRFELDRKDSLLMRRVTDTLLWTLGDSVQAFAIYASPEAAERLGSDTLRHYPKRPGWIEANANGLDYRSIGQPLPAFLLGERSVAPGLLYQHRTVGFRCCAQPK